MLGAQGLWEGRNLYRATPVVTWGLGFLVSSEGLSPLVASYRATHEGMRSQRCVVTVLTRMLKVHSVMVIKTLYK
jgi:hypothetical protein